MINPVKVYDDGPVAAVSDHVLLVDDDKLSGELTILFLRKFYQVDYESDPQRAVHMALQHPYQVILMDINLGHGIRGEEVVRQIKEGSVNRNTPTIALTGYSEEEEKKALLEVWFDQVLGKPFNRDQLLNLVREVIEDQEKRIKST